MTASNHQRVASFMPLILCVLLLLGACKTTPVGSTPPRFTPIPGFTDEANAEFDRLLTVVAPAHEGRKVAVFDCDGTLLSQVPYYLNDEAIFSYIHDHPGYKPETVGGLAKARRDQEKLGWSIVLHGYIDYYAGLPADTLTDWGERIYEQQGLFYPKTVALARTLREHGFEVWVVTGAIQQVYRRFVADELGIPESRVIGTRSLINDGLVTQTYVPPVSLEQGKAQAIQTFIQAQPLLVAGNSRGDFEMILLSEAMRIIVNPDDTQKLPVYGGLTLKGYAQTHDWLIVHCKDVPRPGIGAATAAFGIEPNPSHP